MIQIVDKQVIMLLVKLHIYYFTEEEILKNVTCLNDKLINLFTNHFLSI